MTRILNLLLGVLIFIAFSCKNSDHPQGTPNNSTADTTSYPKVSFQRVKLYTLDSLQKTVIETDSGSYQDTSIVEYTGRAGYSFVDRSGVPKTTHIHTYELTPAEINELKLFLVERPCTDSLHRDKTCAPTFKNVFVFYDEHDKPKAAVHLCFHCEMAWFWPFPDYMCDFDNKVDFKALKKLTERIQKRV